MAALRDDRRRAVAWQVVIAALTAVSLLGSPPAAAQWFAEDPMPPQAVARIVARQGFTELSPPRLAGDVYIVRAMDEDGARVRLVVDAFSGRILRPVGASAELAPPRRRLRPWDYTPDYEEEDREPVERFRERRWSREDLVPPRSIGRGQSQDLPLSREAEIDLDREPIEPFRPRAPEREQRPAPAVRDEPNRRAARVEEPARDPARRSQPARPRGADRPAAAAPAAPAPVVETPARPAEVKADTKPATTAAVPAPAVPIEAAPTTPSAPSPQKPDASPAVSAPPKAQPAPAQQAAGEQPAVAASGLPPKVRVIGGVTPVVPQNPAVTEEGASSQPSKIPQ